MSHLHTVRVAAQEAGKALTPQQKRFNTLIRQIEQARDTLAAWHDKVGSYRQAHAAAVLPLQAEVTAAHRQWLFALDGLLEQTAWTRAERETLRDLVCEAATELLDDNEDDAAVKELYAKHGEVDFDTEQRELLHAAKGLMEAMTGVDLGDDADIQTDADLMQRIEQKTREQAAAAEAQKASKPARRRKTAAQQRRDTEALQATQSVREIYRKLASALHPDREVDPEQQRIKTALMQKVNQAYAANDLLGLLEMQLQIEQVDVKQIAHASAEKLQRYNKVLAGQLAGLKTEIEHVEMQFCMEFCHVTESPIDPRRLGGLLEESVRDLRAYLGQLQAEMRLLADRAAAKRWIKKQRQRLREDELDDPFL